MERLRNGEKAQRPSCRKPALALSGLLLVAPLMGTGCGKDAPQNATAAVACGQGESNVEIGRLGISVKGHCAGSEVDSVDIKMPCGSSRPQERCTLTLPVPGEATFVRSGKAEPLAIVVTETDMGAVVEINRKNI